MFVCVLVYKITGFNDDALRLQDSSKGYMIAFAGAKYAARSVPIMVANNDNVVTSFTLVNG